MNMQKHIQQVAKESCKNYFRPITHPRETFQETTTDIKKIILFCKNLMEKILQNKDKDRNDK